MHSLLFHAWIWMLGLLLAGTVTYGLASYPPATITQYMINHEGYRVALSTAVILQSVVWFACLYAKRARGWLAPVAFALLTGTVVTWLALTTVLTTITHDIFVVACMLTFVLFAGALAFLLDPAAQHAARVLELALLLLVAAEAAVFALYADPHFYIAEHVALYAIALLFVAFFTSHPYSDWEPPPPRPCLPVDIKGYTRI